MPYAKRSIPAAIYALSILLSACHKKSSAPTAYKQSSSMVYHHTDSIYQNIATSPSRDTTYPTGTYADTTISSFMPDASTLLFNGDTLLLDSSVGAKRYYHYYSPAFITNPYTSYCTEDTVAATSHYIRRKHLTSSATQILHLWR